MLLTAIWNMLSTGEVYNPDGYFLMTPLNTGKKELTTKQAVQLLRLRGYVISDAPTEAFIA